jgi:hypothetical protein
MHCIQCGYTTFDYLEACPKCRADFHEDRTRLNLPAGPLRPISLTEIIARVEAHGVEDMPTAGITSAATEKTEKLKTPVMGPKTFDLDLSSETDVENLAEKWLAKTVGTQGKKSGESPLDLSLE